jgi:hypothetical protein
MTWRVFEYVRNVVSERKGAVISWIRSPDHDRVSVSHDSLVYDGWPDFSCLKQLGIDVATWKTGQPFGAVKNLLTTRNLISDLGIQWE